MSFIPDQNVERKIVTILKVLSCLQKPAGSVVVAKLLKDRGVDLSERAIRYHLHITDERGLTQLITERDGRIITQKGLNEIQRALVKDKVGLSISRIEQLAFRTNVDLVNRKGMVPVNISLFEQEKFPEAYEIMAPVFEKSLCVSNLVAVASSGQHLGDVLVPEGCTGLATICSIVINGTLLKAGIPMDSRFGGILQMQNDKPIRFTEMIHYDGTSLDPSEIFIKARMTSVGQVVASGNGEVLANFREIPSICHPIAENIIRDLNNIGFNGVLVVGDVSKSVCEINVDLNKIGIVLLGGLNPVAAATEAGFTSVNHCMSTVIDFEKLVDYRKVLAQTVQHV